MTLEQLGHYVWWFVMGCLGIAILRASYESIRDYWRDRI